jgi:L-seryl-tRNA(Ser) seleniumtransferase
MKNEVIMARSQRNFYDHAVRAVGVRLVEVGLPDRYSGAGVRDTEAWEIADAITPATAAVCYVATPSSLPPLPQVVRVAHAAGVPVLVDAAAQLPPASNLKRFHAEGADLVCFSGGKAIRGPQSSGILCGKRDLISAAALQHLDLDILFDQWVPPPSLIDKSRLAGAPQHGIGRPCKVGKEEIIGLLTALRLFVDEDPEARRRRWLGLMEALAEALRGLPCAEISVAADAKRAEVPMVQLRLDEARAGMTAMDLIRRLQDGDPSIHASPGRVRDGIVMFGPMCLKEGDPAVIARRLRELLR